ncbi:diacylglycerol/lipid kinase family protein [Agromyces marinus]|uniref:Sphingosine kinase n=1 Tax=Agromyces marinus TaxID=1389020 RepID=A0ABM8H0Z6_9MICO|nr:diacylglycerol kinase family protein [Agromyces marinus]UIP57429.1 lipid kinase YegS [Agromyces marinus]BDZ54448.1 sphingosine kinase [Agromyces marinus]
MGGGAKRADAAGSRVAVIVNPSKDGVGELSRAIDRTAAEHGYTRIDWIETTEEDPGTGQAREARESGADLVIAAGGDGTVRSVAEGLDGEPIPVGIVPLGTGNLFARNLGLPVNDIPRAVRLAFTGRDRAIDVLRARVRREDGTTETEVSLVMSGIGIDAAMMATTDPELKKRVGWLAYVDAGLRAIPNSEPFRITHRMDDGRTHRSRVSSLLVANLGYLPGNLELIPDAEIDDGRLDVVRLQPRNVWRWLLVWRKVAWENRVLRRTAIGRQYLDLTGGNRSRDIVYATGRSIDVVIDGAAQEFEVDGDALGEITAARFTIEPKSLVVRVKG